MAGRRLSIEQRVKCVRLFSVTNNVSEVQRIMMEESGPPAVHRDTIVRINKQFDETASALNPKHPGQPRTVRTADTQAHVAAELASYPKKSKSTRRLSALLDISRTSLRRVLSDMKLTPYHLRLIHVLNEDDFDRRLEFAELMLTKFQENPDLIRNIVWTDEAKFHTSGSVNRHKCVFWRPENPSAPIEYDFQSPGVMVWGGVTYEGLIGPFFLEGCQDGAPPHFANIVRAFLHQGFPQRWIGRRGPVEWPARSPDITPPDFFLWCYLKDNVYANPIDSVNHLREVIVQEFNKVPVNMCTKACENVALRLQACVDLGGAQDHRKTLNPKSEETQLGLQAIDTWTKSLRDEIAGTKRRLHEELDLRRHEPHNANSKRSKQKSKPLCRSCGKTGTEKQNTCYWSGNNPRELHERPLHSDKVTVWCALSRVGVIGPYFFEEDNHAVTVNSQQYVHMIKNFFEPALEEMHLGNVWLQQDGATAHKAQASMTVLRAKFPGQLIWLRGDIPWAAHSPDLTPCDFFMWIPQGRGS
ncbi:hypothetical protein B7P43_G04239 [Cryptotermes secundus]|uniref:DUF4817 domain-containing protein n=1 Tax=Cryptotermes secundus TaxID=105785 RepID=A0A2J7QNA2_9NEOP|nr:hypothetical protein B7P43_G04239 [Cryptotermes secundus]